MNYPYESVVIREEIPMFMLMTSVKYIAMHWHDRIEFLFVLKGEVNVFSRGKEYQLKENDVMFINSNEVHGVESNKVNQLLVLQIPVSFIRKFYENIVTERFQCDSFQQEDQQLFDAIRSLIAQLMWFLREKKANSDIKIHSLLLDLVFHLISHFKIADNRMIKQKSERAIERLSSVTSYIEQNYMKPITLQDIAKREELTISYLSRYFHDHMGQSFLKYLNSVRLEHAVRYLTETDWPIIQISMESGFSNLNSFHRVFKEAFHTTPTQYRKQHCASTRYIQHHDKKGREYSSHVDEDALEKLYRFLPETYMKHNEKKQKSI